MKRILKWVGIVVGGLIGLVVVTALVVFAIGSGKLKRTYAYSVERLAVPSDAESIARGEHIFETRFCTDCHGEDLSGTEFLNEPPFGYMPAPNLTAGAGGVGATFSDEDWAVALRHGVGSDGRGLIIMPAEIYTHLNDEDLGALIAYLKQIEPVDNELGKRDLDPAAALFIGVGMIKAAPDLIDHEATQANVRAGSTAEYGAYLAESMGCTLCHGENLAGGVVPGAEPGSPTGPNLTPGGELADWTEADFVMALRNGVSADGMGLDLEWMPWRITAKMTDDELAALWAYVQSVPAVAGE